MDNPRKDMEELKLMVRRAIALKVKNGRGFGRRVRAQDTASWEEVRRMMRAHGGSSGDNPVAFAGLVRMAIRSRVLRGCPCGVCPSGLAVRADWEVTPLTQKRPLPAQEILDQWSDSERGTPVEQGIAS